jgi:outer membrane biosynthesis protein TonB
MKEPHFDDRRVLQRARQVVPLGKIRARRVMFLSGAFVIAMMLGAASALLAVRIQQHRQITQVNTEINTDSEPATSVPETVAAVPGDSAADAPATEEAAPPVKPVRPKQQQPAVAERPRMVGTRSNEVQPTEEEQLQQIRDAVLYDRWQERRMRRAARRERRNLGDRDLSHVDEIFEGRRPPQRP